MLLAAEENRTVFPHFQHHGTRTGSTCSNIAPSLAHRRACKKLYVNVRPRDNQASCKSTVFYHSLHDCCKRK